MKNSLSLCLIQEKEIQPFIGKLSEKYRESNLKVFPKGAGVEIIIEGKSDVKLMDEIKDRFATFFYSENSIEEAVHQEMIQRKKTLSLAESCTGGALAAKLTAIPGASNYFLGSIVTYADSWKERFLEVSRTTLEKYGAVSKETVMEMVKGLLLHTDADFAIAISGIAGPSGGTQEKPVGTIYIAIAERGNQIDVGRIQAPQTRERAIDFSASLSLGALYRRVAHNEKSFS